jgi:hypothetical protein
MHIFDPRLAERARERGLGEAGPARQRQRANVDYPLDPGCLERRDELVRRRAFISDGEDPHSTTLTALTACWRNPR